MKRERISFPFRFPNNDFNKYISLYILRFLCKIEFNRLTLSIIKHIIEIWFCKYFAEWRKLYAVRI